MSIVLALSKSVSEQYSNFDKLQNKQQVQILRGMVQHAVKKSLNQIKLPKDKEKIAYEIKKLQNKTRHKEKYKKIHDLEINDDLIDILYRLDRIQTKTSKNDFDSQIQRIDVTNLNQSTTDIASDQSNELKFEHTDFAETKTKYSVFKFDVDEDIFTDEIKLKNHITRSEIKLKESINEIFETYEKSKSIFVTSLFHLYDFQNFVTFLQKLQDKFETKSEKYLSVALESSYKLMKNYYMQLLLLQGIKVRSERQLENSLLLNSRFMSMSEHHPLMIGFHLLLTHSLDWSKLLKLVEKDIFDIFSTSETRIEPSDKISNTQDKNNNFDYDSEILELVKKQGEIKQSNLLRKFLHHPISVKEVILRLESYGLLKIVQIENDALILKC